MEETAYGVNKCLIGVINQQLPKTSYIQATINLEKMGAHLDCPESFEVLKLPRGHARYWRGGETPVSHVTEIICAQYVAGIP